MEQEQAYQIVAVYEAMENLDKLEGHGAYKTVAYSLNEELAKQLARGDNAIPGKVARHAAILLNDGTCFLLALSMPIQLETDMDGAMRNIALAKLTPEERHVLGLQ